jgi:hypothetical protein
MSEDELLTLVLDLAALNHWRCFHVRDSKRGIVQGPGGVGFPDLVITDGVRVLFRELKRDGARLRPDQAEWGELLQAAGHDWRIWRPSDEPAIRSELERRA